MDAENRYSYRILKLVSIYKHENDEKTDQL